MYIAPLFVGGCTCSYELRVLRLVLICSRRYELRVRYLPRSFHDLMAKDTETFYYFYEQVSTVSTRTAAILF